MKGSELACSGWKATLLAIACAFFVPLVLLSILFGSGTDLPLYAAWPSAFAMAVGEFCSKWSRGLRIAVLASSFFVPWGVVLLTANAMGLYGYGLGYGYIAGCIGLGTMGICLIARRFWWLFASFLFPFVSVYGFWGCFLYSLHKWRSGDSSLGIFVESVWLALISDMPKTYYFVETPECFRFHINGLAWGELGLLLSLSTWGAFKLAKSMLSGLTSSTTKENAIAEPENPSKPQEEMG